jgi:transposase InsO family protein
VDLFRCESILLRSYWGLVVMDIFTRRIIGFGVAREYIDGVTVCRMFNQAVAGQPRPKHLSSDHAPLFRFHRWLANLRVLEIDEIKSVPYFPVSHPFIERLIGTVRGEYLDRLFFWNSVDLTRKLAAFRDYSNEFRVHRSLGGTTPARQAGAASPPSAAFNTYAWQQHCQRCSRLRSQPDLPPIRHPHPRA